MKNFLKYYLSPLLLAGLLLAGLWYWRGVDFAVLAGEMAPETVNVLVMTLSDDGLLYVDYEVEAASPEGREILDTLYALTIHRPPTNLLYQILQPTASSQQFEAGDYAFVVRVFGAGGGHAALQFHVRKWSCDAVDGEGYLPCSVEGGAETGRAFGRQLWALAEKLDCIE